MFLAPTELLADQHAETLKPTAEKLGLRLGVLTGALSKDQRRSMLDRLATGAVDLVVGTHALLSGEVRFANLGLVIVDEQHRFGVAQRLRLGKRGSAGRPHLLVMTATPIPRSLALGSLRGARADQHRGQAARTHSCDDEDAFAHQTRHGLSAGRTCARRGGSSVRGVSRDLGVG